MHDKISWWRTKFGNEEIQHVVNSIKNECVSQGKVTTEFENKLSEFLEIENVIAVSSGSSALLLALMAVGVKPGDEVIVPNRSWIATAHAAYLLGAKVVLVDVEPNRPIIDVEKIEEKLTSRTRVIMPVHMNGRSANMDRINEIAKKHKIAVIEDAAQAIASRNTDGFLGTQSDIGCFSLSVAKTIATGQGGFAVTNNNEIAKRMRTIRTHGVENVNDVEQWGMPGFNFRYTDIQASIGIEQLKRLPERVDHLREIYMTYEHGLNDTPFKLIPVNLDKGEVPVYSEFLINERAEWISLLASENIETRAFYPDLNTAPYFNQQDIIFQNSISYGKDGVYLPSGPSQNINTIKYCIDKIKSLSI